MKKIFDFGVIFALMVIGNLICSLPLVFTEFSINSILYNALTSVEFVAPLVGGIMVCMPMCIELYFDWNMSLSSTEKLHFITRILLLLNLLVPNAILLVALHSDLSVSVMVRIYMAVSTNRYIMSIGAVLYYFSECLKSSTFTVRNSSLILVLFIFSRFGGVFSSMHPSTRAYRIILILGYLAGTISFVTCMFCWWRRSRKDILSHQAKKSTYLCSKIYLVVTLLQIILAVSISASCGSDSNIQTRNSICVSLFLYGNILFSIIIVAIPGRYARLENIATMADLNTKKTFIRFVSHEIRGPLSVIEMGLSSLDSVVDTAAETECPEVLKRNEMIHTIQKQCNGALKVLDALLLYDQLEKGLFQLELISVHALSCLDGGIKKCLAEYRTSHPTLSYEYDLGLRDNPKFLSDPLTQVCINVDERRLEEVIGVIFHTVSHHARLNSKISLNLELIPSGALGGDSGGQIAVATSTEDPDAPQPVGRLRLSLEFAHAHSNNSDGSSFNKRLFEFVPDSLQNSGLNLKLSREIIELHKGTLDVYTKPQPGGHSGKHSSYSNNSGGTSNAPQDDIISVFYMELPCHKAERHSDNHLLGSVNSRETSHRVNLSEDPASGLLSTTYNTVLTAVNSPAARKTSNIATALVNMIQSGITGSTSVKIHTGNSTSMRSDGFQMLDCDGEAGDDIENQRFVSPVRRKGAPETKATLNTQMTSKTMASSSRRFKMDLSRSSGGDGDGGSVEGDDVVSIEENKDDESTGMKCGRGFEQNLLQDVSDKSGTQDAATTTTGIESAANGSNRTGNTAVTQSTLQSDRNLLPQSGHTTDLQRLGVVESAAPLSASCDTNVVENGSVRRGVESSNKNAPKGGLPYRILSPSLHTDTGVASNSSRSTVGVAMSPITIHDVDADNNKKATDSLEPCSLLGTPITGQNPNNSNNGSSSSSSSSSDNKLHHPPGRKSHLHNPTKLFTSSLVNSRNPSPGNTNSHSTESSPDVSFRKTTEATATAATTVSKKKASAGPPMQYRVLIVDDQDMIRKMLAHNLKRKGFVCDTVCDGEDAVLVMKASLKLQRELDGVSGSNRDGSSGGFLTRMLPSAKRNLFPFSGSSSSHPSRYNSTDPGDYSGSGPAFCLSSSTATFNPHGVGSPPQILSGKSNEIEMIAASDEVDRTTVTAIATQLRGSFSDISALQQPSLGLLGGDDVDRQGSSAVASLVQAPTGLHPTAAMVGSPDGINAVNEPAVVEGNHSDKGQPASSLPSVPNSLHLPPMVYADGLGESDVVPALYDLITMDHNMIRMHGPTATKLIRQAGYKGAIIAVTGNALNEDQTTFLKAGANGVCLKPIDFDRFTSIFETHITSRPSATLRNSSNNNCSNNNNSNFNSIKSNCSNEQSQQQCSGQSNQSSNDVQNLTEESAAIQIDNNNSNSVSDLVVTNCTDDE